MVYDKSRSNLKMRINLGFHFAKLRILLGIKAIIRRYSPVSYYLPVPKREVSMLVSLGLKPLNRQMKVSLKLRDISRTFIR